MPETIMLKEVLDEMDSGRRFDIQFVTADRKRGTGGQVRGLLNVIKLFKAHGEKQAHPIPELDSIAELRKNPRHYENSTRNIYNPRERDRSKQVIKVHLRLIIHFNGKAVI